MWLTNVRAISPGSSVAGRQGRARFSTHRGQGCARLVRCQRRKSPKVLPADASGLKKLVPSKWSDFGPRWPGPPRSERRVAYAPVARPSSLGERLLHAVEVAPLRAVSRGGRRGEHAATHRSVRRGSRLRLQRPIQVRQARVHAVVDVRVVVVEFLVTVRDARGREAPRQLPRAEVDVVLVAPAAVDVDARAAGAGFGRAGAPAGPGRARASAASGSRSIRRCRGGRAGGSPSGAAGSGS